MWLMEIDDEVKDAKQAAKDEVEDAKRSTKDEVNDTKRAAKDNERKSSNSSVLASKRLEVLLKDLKLHVAEFQDGLAGESHFQESLKRASNI